jgi:hypothetical protein
MNLQEIFDKQPKYIIHKRNGRTLICETKAYFQTKFKGESALEILIQMDNAVLIEKQGDTINISNTPKLDFEYITQSWIEQGLLNFQAITEEQFNYKAEPYKSALDLAKIA